MGSSGRFFLSACLSARQQPVEVAEVCRVRLRQSYTIGVGCGTLCRESRRGASKVKRNFGVLVVLSLAFVLIGPQLVRGAEQERGKGWFGRSWLRSWSPHTTNNASVKSAFKEAISDASAASVTILSDGEPPPSVLFSIGKGTLSPRQATCSRSWFVKREMETSIQRRLSDRTSPMILPC